MEYYIILPINEQRPRDRFVSNWTVSCFEHSNYRQSRVFTTCLRRVPCWQPPPLPPSVLVRCCIRTEMPCGGLEYYWRQIGWVRVGLSRHDLMVISKQVLKALWQHKWLFEIRYFMIGSKTECTTKSSSARNSHVRNMPVSLIDRVATLMFEINRWFIALTNASFNCRLLCFTVDICILP